MMVATNEALAYTSLYLQILKKKNEFWIFVLSVKLLKDKKKKKHHYHKY